MHAAVGWRTAGVAGAAAAVLLLTMLAYTPRRAPVQLLAAQEAAWDRQETSLWKPMQKKAAPRVLHHGEMKLKHILRGLRQSHLLRRKQLREVVAARQPHFGPGRVVEEPGIQGMRVFKGRMLCSEGESSCVHPCNAFYTITGEEPPEDCKCKCTSPNPHSFYKVCTWT